MTITAHDTSISLTTLRSTTTKEGRATTIPDRQSEHQSIETFDIEMICRFVEEENMRTLQGLYSRFVSVFVREKIGTRRGLTRVANETRDFCPPDNVPINCSDVNPYSPNNRQQRSLIDSPRIETERRLLLHRVENSAERNEDSQ